MEVLGLAKSPTTAFVFVVTHMSTAGVCMQFDKVVSGLIGVHAFTVLGPQILVLQKMLAAVCPKGTALVFLARDPRSPARAITPVIWHKIV